eukprot:379853-Rhodomonas_salina.1
MHGVQGSTESVDSCTSTGASLRSSPSATHGHEQDGPERLLGLWGEDFLQSFGAADEMETDLDDSARNLICDLVMETIEFAETVAGEIRSAREADTPGNQSGSKRLEPA